MAAFLAVQPAPLQAGVAASTVLAAARPDAGPPLGLTALRQLCEKTTLPCIAIGGIGVDNAHAVSETGVAGVCVVSALCTADDPADTASALREAVDR